MNRFAFRDHIIFPLRCSRSSQMLIWMSVITFFQLAAATITLVTDTGGPVGDSTVSLIRHRTSKQPLISKEQSGDL